jgi:two-component sensor histidine kinase
MPASTRKSVRKHSKVVRFCPPGPGVGGLRDSPSSLVLITRCNINRYYRPIDCIVVFTASYRHSMDGEPVMSSVARLREPDLSAPKADGLLPREADQFLFLRELHHRLANTFSVLASALRRDFGSPISTEFRRSLDQYESRIVAFGNLHRSLVIGVLSDCISVQYYVEDLCKALSAAILEPIGVRCEVGVDAGELPGQHCELLGLVIAELVMNAANHAFHERNDGLVRVELTREADSWLCIVSDNGNGVSTGSPGVGSKIVGQLTRALGGRYVRTSGQYGTSVAITCPIAVSAPGQAAT